ncbi:hypothetical protein LuPra_04338 [Luteitalea pratensis]|uniref:Uncharacterized protein n=1 Tax=Luteitalea pratensis TaxID=1855912 RepID=A0A143PSF0_LUTPR|nr:hypothetical protein [Luteitalea pratensis]AMY11093.1 hypothetical protein LuPra_04338 [Luteitalea pratensis]
MCVAGVVAAGVLLAARPQAQNPAQPPLDRPSFRAEIALVEVSAVVTGDGDAPIS